MYVHLYKYIYVYLSRHSNSNLIRQLTLVDIPNCHLATESFQNVYLHIYVYIHILSRQQHLHAATCDCRHYQPSARIQMEAGNGYKDYC